MSDLPIQFPESFPEDRAESVAEGILAELYERGYKYVYIDKVGDLTLLVEALHIHEEGEPYIDIELTSWDVATCPRTVKTAIRRIRDDHPGRRAYYPNLSSHSNQTRKVVGWKATPMDDPTVQSCISDVVDEWADVDRWDILRTLKRSRPLPWEDH